MLDRSDEELQALLNEEKTEISEEDEHFKNSNESPNWDQQLLNLCEIVKSLTDRIAFLDDEVGKLRLELTLRLDFYGRQTLRIHGFTGFKDRTKSKKRQRNLEQTFLLISSTIDSKILLVSLAAWSYIPVMVFHTGQL